MTETAMTGDAGSAAREPATLANRPPGATGQRTRGAGAAAARALPDDRVFGEPCATCPKPLPPDTEMDGALVGRDCTAMTNPRARGRLEPRQVVVGYTASRTGLRVPITGDDPADAALRHQPLTRNEIKAALAREHTTRSTSRCCARMRAARGERTIVYTNGIKTHLAEHCATLRAIAETTCADVVGVYNATEGQVADLLQSKADRNAIEAAAVGRPFALGDRRNPAADTLNELMFQTQRDPGLAGGPVDYMAHSQGGAITSLALHRANYDLRLRGVQHPFEGTRVTSFNAAAPSWVDGPTYTHFVHQSDFVGMRTGIGADHGVPGLVGRGATVVEFSDPTVTQALAFGLDPNANGTPRYQWRELRDGHATGRGGGDPSVGAASYAFWVSAHHGIDQTSLGVYRQYAQTVSGRGSVCPDGRDDD